jgi:hypothetical protein
MRRIAALLAVAAVSFAAPGCGGDDPKPISPLDDALGYFAKDAPFVAAIETDPDGAQVEQVRSLVGRFPFAGAAAGRLQQLTRFDFIRYERDVQPQLGAPLVAGLTRPAAGKGLATVLVVAMRLKEPLKMKQTLLRQPGFRGRGTSSGVRIYENPATQRYAAVVGDALVAATDRDILEQALAMHRSDNRMHESGFNRDLAGLPKGALARVSADPRTMLGADERLRPALNVKWLSSMRRLGATLKALGDGVALDVRIATDAGVIGDGDLPFAPRPGPLPLIGGKGDVQVGVREPGRLLRLAIATWRAIAPRQAARLKAIEPPGVDLERQFPRHLTDTGVLAYNPSTRDFAARAAIREASDVKAGLDQLAPVLPEVAALFGVRGVGVATPEVGENFYALANPNGRTLVFGVVGAALVVAREARRAAGLASEPTHSAKSPPAAAVLTVNAREVAGRLLADRLGGAAALAAPLAVSALRDLTGWLKISQDGLRAHLKLTVAR